jgi:hypothetical protein
MSETHGSKPDDAWRVSRGDARATIKRLRAQVQAYCRIPKIAADGSSFEKPSAHQVVVGDLPDCLQRLLQAYRERHPDLEVEPISHLTFGPTDARGTPLALENLPDEENLVVLICTESVADITEVHVQTETLLVRGRRRE